MLQCIYLFIASRALVFVVSLQLLSVYKFIHAIDKCNFWVPLGKGNMQSERTFLTVSVWLIFAWFTKHSASRFESEHLKQGSLELVLDNILLYWLLVVETRFDHMIQKAYDELLGVFLLPKPVQRHNSSHEWEYEIKRRLLLTVWLLNELNVCAQKTLSLLFFSIAKLLVTLIRKTKLMQRYSMKKTLHYRVKKTGVSSIIHSKCNFFIL